MNGEVRIWDVRAPDSPLVEVMAQQNGLCALAVHDCAPVFATSVLTLAQLALAHSFAGLPLLQRIKLDSEFLYMALIHQSLSFFRQWTFRCLRLFTLRAASVRSAPARLLWCSTPYVLSRGLFDRLTDIPVRDGHGSQWLRPSRRDGAAFLVRSNESVTEL